MAIEKELLYHKTKQRNRIYRTIFTTAAAALAISIGGISYYWDELQGTEKIRADIYQIIHEKNSPELTIFLKKRDATNIRRTHSYAEIDELNKVAQDINTVCPNNHDANQFSPHRDFTFESSEAALNCLHNLRKIHLPGT